MKSPKNFQPFLSGSFYFFVNIFSINIQAETSPTRSEQVFTHHSEYTDKIF